MRKNAKTFHIGSVRAGDVIFMDARSIRLWPRTKRFFNVIGQRLLASLRREQAISMLVPIPKHSHVMLGLNGGVVVHADGKSVAIDIVADALEYGTPTAAKFRAFRYREMTTGLSEEIARQAVRYYRKGYRFLPYFSDDPGDKDWHSEDTAQFCSSLIAKAYRRAGIELSQLPDNKVLPVDLYRICSNSDKWEDITDLLEGETIEGVDEVFPPIDIGRGPMKMSEFFEHTDRLLREGAENSIKVQTLQYDNIREIIRTQALLSKYVAAQFTVAKGVRLKPDAMDDAYAEVTSRVLEQLEQLLEMAQLEDLEVLIQDSGINSGDQTTGLYAGLPPPSVIRGMQIDREMIRAFTYLLHAETGLMAIIAKAHPASEKVALFRAVDRKYTDQFLSALPRIDALERFEAQDGMFKWIGNDRDRAACRTQLANIVGALKVIEILRTAAARAKSQ